VTPGARQRLESLSGCRIDAQGVAGLHRVECPDHESKVKLLDDAAWEDARHDPRVRALAADLVRPLRTLQPSALAPALHAAVKRRVRFVGEGIETFQQAIETWELALGDCDDSARLLLALARALGLKSELGVLRRPDGTPSHAAAKLWDGRALQWAETTLDARFGEHPQAALRRLKRAGKAPEPRDDIGGLGDLGGLSVRDQNARSILEQAWVMVKGLPEATPSSLQAAQAIARFEGTYGEQWKRCPRVVNNWGAVQVPGTAREMDQPPPTCPPGSAICTDTRPTDSGKSVPFQVCFDAPATPQQGAATFLRTLLAQRPPVADVIASGNADAIASAMHRTHYFGGFGKTDAERIGNYAKAIASNASSVASGVGEPLMVRRGGFFGAPPGATPWIAAAAIAAAGGGAWWWWYRRRRRGG